FHHDIKASTFYHHVGLPSSSFALFTISSQRDASSSATLTRAKALPIGIHCGLLRPVHVSPPHSSLHASLLPQLLLQPRCLILDQRHPPPDHPLALAPLCSLLATLLTTSRAESSARSVGLLCAGGPSGPPQSVRV